MQDEIFITMSGTTYVVSTAPKWAEGPIDYEFVGDFIKINDIPGFPDHVRGSMETLWRYYDPEADEHYGLISDSCPEDDLIGGNMFIWGDSNEVDRRKFRLHSDLSHVARLFELYAEAYRRSNGHANTINGSKSTVENYVPEIGDAYFFREDGVIISDTWLYRDIDLERWNTQPIAPHIGSGKL